MSFHIQQFYEELDRHYQEHDNEKTKAFLLSMVAKTRGLHDVSVIPISCPSCVEMPTVNLEYVSVCNETACFFRGISEWQQSLTYFDYALEELALFYQKNTANYATILLNKAGTLRLLGQYDKAIESFRQAEHYFLHEDTTNHYLLASIYNNLSLVYQDTGQLQEAADCTLKSLSCLPKQDDLLVERATTLNNLSVIYDRLGNTEKAKTAILDSIAILKDMDCGVNAHYPAALNTMATLLFKEGLYIEALASFKEALEKTELVYGKNIDYVNGCLNLAETCEKLNDQAMADTWRNEAETIKNQLQ